MNAMMRTIDAFDRTRSTAGFKLYAKLPYAGWPYPGCPAPYEALAPYEAWDPHEAWDPYAA